MSEELFTRHGVVIGLAKQQIVLSGHLLGGTVADLAVVRLDEHGERGLHIYVYDGDEWVSSINVPLGRAVLFVDVAKIGGRERLITYELGRVAWFDPESATFRGLVDVTSTYKSPHGDRIANVDISRDVNGDGRDDLIVPGNDGIRVLIQLTGGLFGDPVEIGPSFDMKRLYDREGYRFDLWDLGRVHEVDYNRDGRTDLVFWSEDHFRVHLQDKQGLFSAGAETLTTDVAFDSDDMASLAAPYGIQRRRMDQNPVGAMKGRVLHSISDLNGDGIADLGVFSLQGGSLWKMQSTYEVHLGTPAPDGGTMFATEAGATIQLEGILSSMKPQDVDRDGQMDMSFRSINPGVFKAMGMIVDSVLTGSVSMDLTFYRMEGGRYPAAPNTTRTIRTTSFGKSGEKATQFPTVLIGDVNGDGRADLLVQRGKSELRVYLGVPGPGLFEKRPHKVSVAMPNEEYTWLVDLNRDGKQDVLMHHLSTTGASKLTVLMAR